ncbi:YcgN family cysteine cluster protein [bacterium]|nr:YcgN family cysteine cluster protein [bacterium]
MTPQNDRFWETKDLSELTSEEWESLCDGCAICCLHKIEEEKTGDIYYTYVSCLLLDNSTCRCKSYENRFSQVKDCLKIKLKGFNRMHLLPESCAYRRLSESKNLEWWHPLISNDPNTVHEANISIRDKAIPEENVHPDEIINFVFFKVE